MELTRGELDALFGLSQSEKQAVLSFGDAKLEPASEEMRQSLFRKELVNKSGSRLTKLGKLVREKLQLMDELKRNP